jgi:hypothetical protein
LNHRQIQDGAAELGRHNIRVRGPGVMGNLPGLIFLRAISQNENPKGYDSGRIQNAL